MEHGMWRRAVSLAAAVALGVSFSVAALAHGHGHGDWGDPAKIEKHVNEHVEKIIKTVKATDDQKAKIYQIRDRLMPDLLTLVKDKRAAKQEFKDAWKQPTFDSAKLNAMVDRVADEHRAFAHKIVEAKAEMHKLLTPEQRDKLAKMYESMHKDRAEHMHKKGAEKPSKTTK